MAGPAAAPSELPAGPDTGSPIGAVVLGRYELRERVGRGRSGVVWRANDLLLRRDVALRTLRTSREADPAGARERAHREGRAAAQVHHPCLAALYDMAEQDGDIVLVSEYLHGPALESTLCVNGPLPARHVAQLAGHLAAGLAVAHAHGVVHGGIAPATVLLGVTDDGTPDGTAALADFGVAAGDAHPAGGAVTAFTPPEVARGGPMTPAGDVWALGATLHTAVEGHPPVDPAGRPVPPWHPGPLGGLLAAMLSPDPAARPDAARARAALEALADAADAPDAAAPASPTGTAFLPVDAGAFTAPQPRVPAVPAPSAPAPRTRVSRAAHRPPIRQRRRLIGAGVVGTAGLLAAGVVGVVAASVSPTATTTTALPPTPALGPQPAPTPAVEPPITPVEPPPIVAVPMEADPLLAAATQAPSRDRDRGSDDHDHDRDRDRGSDDDGDGDHKDRSDRDDRKDKKDRDSDRDDRKSDRDSDRGSDDDSDD